MSNVLRRAAVLSLAGFTMLLAAPLPAQQQMQPKGPQMIPFAGAGGNVGAQASGTASAGAAGGYNLSPQPAGGTPYATGSLSSSPYGGYALSTMGSNFGSPYGGYGYNPYGSPYVDPLSSSLFGAAAQTQAIGRYLVSVQEARLLREQSRQSAIDTARKRIQFEAWYESQRVTAPQIQQREAATELERARRNAQATDIWSGRALNELLRSTLRTGKLVQGKTVPLEEDTLKHINLSDGASNGNVGLLKDGGKLTWPAALQEAAFEEPRERLSKNLRLAVFKLKEKDPLTPAELNNIEADYKALSTRLGDSADELTAAQYIESKRYLNQVGLAIKALRNPKVANHFNNTWNAKGKTVAELVDHMRKEGLRFAPAAPGDEASYTSLYQALRAFESDLHAAQR